MSSFQEDLSMNYTTWLINGAKLAYQALMQDRYIAFGYTIETVNTYPKELWDVKMKERRKIKDRRL